MRRSNRRALFLLPVSVFMVAVLGGFVTGAAATGPGGFRAAKPGEPTYVLTGLTVEFPYTAPDGVVDESEAGVRYDIAWSTPTYPGRAECELLVLDDDGSVVGSSRYEFMNLVPQVAGDGPLPVPISGVPASVEAACAAATPESGDYRISNPAVVTDADGATTLVADVAFGSDERPGVGACRASLTLASGANTTWAFTLSAPEGRMVIAFLDSAFQGASVQSVSCGPYSTPDSVT